MSSPGGTFSSHRSGRGHRRTWVAVAICAVLVGSGTGAAWGVDQARADLIPRGPSVAGQDIGGLTVEQALNRVTPAIEAPLRRPLTLRAGPETHQTTRWDLGFRVDVEGAVRDAVDGYRSAPLPRRVWERLAGSGGSVDAEPRIDLPVLKAVLRTLGSSLAREPRDARVEVQDGWLRMVPSAPGLSVDTSAAVRAVTAALHDESDPVELPVEVVPPAVSDDAVSSAILVRRGDRQLHHYVDGQIVRSYPIAVGKAGYATPTGTFEVTAKRRNPSWYNPGSSWARGMPRMVRPGPNNPLGTRALNISSPGIRIHGTSQSGSIGTAASHGCIRMHRTDVEELFELIDVGTPVVIVP